MNIEQYLLTKLAEECSEVAQIALKTQQFGMDEVCHGQPYSNKQRCHQELDDLMAIVGMLNDIGFGYCIDNISVLEKEEKVEKYLKYSISLGMVDDTHSGEGG